MIELGIREGYVEDNVYVSAKDAYDILQASNLVSFTNGFITDSEGVHEEQLKTVLSELNEKGMLLAPSFKPSLSLEVTGDLQSDSENIVTMVRAGYSYCDSNVSEDGSLTFTNVFMSLKDFINFTDSENFSDNSVIPKFTASFVTVKNLQELNAISTDLQSENSSLLSLGIDRIALQGNIAPTFSHISRL